MMSRAKMIIPPPQGNSDQLEQYDDDYCDQHSYSENSSNAGRPNEYGAKVESYYTFRRHRTIAECTRKTVRKYSLSEKFAFRL